MDENQARAVATVATTVIAGVPAVALGAGPWGIALGLGCGIVTWGFGDVAYKATRALVLSEEMDMIRDAIGTLGPAEEDLHPDQNTFSKIKRLAGMKSAMAAPASSKEVTPQVAQASNKAIPLGPAKPVKEVSRVSIEQVVSSAERNSFKVCIGRSLTKQGNPPASVNFYKQHFKFIGASQKGKSSMVAAFLDAVTRTHDEDHVLIALLDLEDRTSRLFADLPHVAEVAAPGGPVLLHARSHDQVLEHLELLILVMTERYQMSPAEVLREPILLVYIEEFLSLKNYFKQKDKQKYTRLVFCINELARRGLKARVQLLLCAQVDYRDEDFQEALINVSCGMAFCVRQSATQAAGFYNTELLRQNVMDNKVGQAVAEMPDCNDLILAPDYDLEQKLIELEEVDMHRGTKKVDSILAPAKGHKNASTRENRGLRLVESGFEEQPYTRNGYTRNDPASSIGEENDFDIYAQQNSENEPVERTQENAKYRLDNIQLELFCVAYELTGNIDDSLKRSGAHTGYRQHARQIIAERNLKRSN